MTLKGNKGH